MLHREGEIDANARTMAVVTADVSPSLRAADHPNGPLQLVHGLLVLVNSSAEGNLG